MTRFLLAACLSLPASASAQNALAPGGGLALYAPAPASGAAALRGLARWLNTAAGQNAISLNPVLADVAGVDLRTPAGQAALAPLAWAAGADAELAAMETLDAARQSAVLGKVLAALPVAAKAVEARLSEAVAGLERQAPAGRVSAEAVERLASELKAYSFYSQRLAAAQRLLHKTAVDIRSGKSLSLADAVARGLRSSPDDAPVGPSGALKPRPSGLARPAPTELERLSQLQAQYAPVELKVDLSSLPPQERAALAKMVEASERLDALFLRQAWDGNEKMLAELHKDPTPLGRARLRYFLTNKGPWDRLDHNKPFIPGAPEKPEQANFYPKDATKEEVAAWIKGLSPKEQERATGFYTTIRRGADGKLSAVPYSVEYRKELEQASRLLSEAAALTEQPTLKNFLTKRAAAFLSNDYYDSEVAWMELDATIEPTIGPYENYEDGWFNYKAAFESFITVLDAPGTRELHKFSSQLQWLEDNLPIDPKDRNPKLGALSPIRVVNQVHASGDAAKGVATAAFNLPNDELVVKEKGSKRTMLKNVQEAKFAKVLLPIASVSLAKEDQGNVDFRAFFTHILMHELMHGLGPHDIADAQGLPTTVRKALKETSSAFEEAKADISGLWALQKLIDKGQLDKSLEKTMYDTFLASSFRTIRFGISEAHGKGMAMQLNYLLDQGAVVVAPDGTFAVAPAKIKRAVESLTREIMTIQARGDYDAARAMLARLGVVRPEVRAVIDKMSQIPVDIEPRQAVGL